MHDVRFTSETTGCKRVRTGHGRHGALICQVLVACSWPEICMPIMGPTEKERRKQ